MNGLDFTSDRNTFTLHEPVKLEQVFPYGWDKAGGGILRVSGSNFAKGSSQCTFGAGGTGTVPAVSTLSPSEVVSSAFMKCETPIFSSKGMTDVSIRSWGTSGSLSGSRAFQVWSEPCSIEVSNSWDVNSTLAERGGLSVLLQGKGNEELVEPLNMFGYSCHFGTVTVSAVMDTLLINGTVTCISPASPRPSTYVDLWTGQTSTHSSLVRLSRSSSFRRIVKNIMMKSSVTRRPLYTQARIFRQYRLTST